MIIPGVSNVKDSLIKTEESFRQNRAVSNSEIKKGPHCKINNMREVLKNWFTPHDIPEQVLSKKNKQRYRGLVYAYLRDKNTNKCPSAFKPLIEEYLPFLSKGDEMSVKEMGKMVQKQKKEKQVSNIGHNIEELVKYSKQLEKLGIKELKITTNEVEICLNIL